MECPQTRYKVEEAEYFLSKVLEFYNDDRLFGFYFNAFLISAKSVIDYVRTDFFVQLSPSISTKTWDKSQRDKEQRKKIIEEHPQKIILRKFLKDHHNEINCLKKDPMLYYFLNKRNVIVHHKYAAAMGGSFTQTQNSWEKIYHKRYLETAWEEEFLDRYPDLRIDLGNIKLSEQAKADFEDKIRHQDIKPHLRYFIAGMRCFVEKFEQKNYS